MKRAILEIIGGIACIVVYAVLGWLLVWGAPDQMSGEYDLATQEMRGCNN